MGPRRFVPLLVALVLVATTITAAGASGGHHPLGGSVETSTPPGAATTVTSGVYDNDIKSADVLMDPGTMSQATFKTIAFALMSAKSKSRRVVVCATVAAGHMDYVRDRLESEENPIRAEQIEAIAGSRGAAYALTCMNMVRLMAEIEAEGPPTRSAARGGGCDVIPFQLRVTTRRTESGDYRMVPKSALAGATKAMPVRTTCTTGGGKLTMQLQPKKKRLRLSQVAGKRLVVGVANPSTNEETADVTVGFKGR